MAKIVRVHLDDETERRLAVISKELDRTESDLLESAVAEAVLDYWRVNKVGQNVDAPPT
jgi:predicted transcriptional regulator